MFEDCGVIVGYGQTLIRGQGHAQWVSSFVGGVVDDGQVPTLQHRSLDPAVVVGEGGFCGFGPRLPVIRALGSVDRLSPFVSEEST